VKSIWVFGDSYAAPDLQSDWPARVGQGIGDPVRNYAISGGSTEYAVRTLFGRINHIPDDDVVIFVASTLGRIHFEFQNQQPHTSTWKDGSDLASLNDGPSQWFKDNRDHLRWYLTNQDLGLASITHFGYKTVLKNFAESRSGIVLFLENSNTNPPAELVNIPNNFINPKIFLNTISECEIINRSPYDEWVKHTVWDARINHMTLPNLATLANLVVNVINHPTAANIDAFQYKEFRQDIMSIITSPKDFDFYVQNGYLHPDRLLRWHG